MKLQALLIFFAVLAAIKADTPDVSSQPNFDYSVPRNVTITVGETAFLNCRVEHLGEYAVIFLVLVSALESSLNKMFSSRP